LCNAGVNVIPHLPHPGTRWGFVANLIANINKFPRPWGSCPPIKVLKCSHHVGLEMMRSPINKQNANQASGVFQEKT